MTSSDDERLHKREFTKADGRPLVLYGSSPHTLDALPEADAPANGRPHLRWHPLRGEWLMFAEHRRRRDAAETTHACPLCPQQRNGPLTEIPFTDFEVAVFENRFAALRLASAAPPDAPTRTRPAVGVCEVVVYSPQHTASLATLTNSQRELLLRAWIDRYRSLYALPEVQFVFPFENRGSEVGMSIDHAHGQIYAMPHLPNIIQREVEAFRAAPVLDEALPKLKRYIVAQDEHTVAFVPPWARYDYEVWVTPRRRQPGPWTFTPAEVASFSRMLGEVVRRYDTVADRAFPFVMLFHAAPKGTESYFHFHVKFYPPSSPGRKNKRISGVDYGLLLVESLPEEAASVLRQAGPSTELLY